jgi:hypothetical protein
MQQIDATLDDIVTSGLKLMVLLYNGSTRDTLNSLRYNTYCTLSSTTSRRPEPQQLPPTERAAVFHILRVHQQVVVWKHLNHEALDPLKWGWQLHENKLTPVMTDLPVAPDEVLNVVRCNCKAGCASTACTCRKNGLTCVAACGHCHGETCSNIDSPKDATVGSGPNSFFCDFDFMNDWDVIDEEVVDSEDFGLF